MDERTERKLLERLDRAEILDCITRYARGMDRLDRALARSAYHEGAIDDHVGFVGEVDDFLDWAFAYHGNQLRHQHYITNHYAELHADEAHAETYFIFIGTESDPAAHLRPSGAATSTASNGARGSGASRSASVWSSGQQTRNRSFPQTLPISWPRQGRWHATPRTAPTNGPCSRVAGP